MKKGLNNWKRIGIENLTRIEMSYLHNGLQFKFLSRHYKHDLYGSGPLRIMIDRQTKRVIGDFMAGKAPDILGNKIQKRKVKQWHNNKQKGNV